MLLCRQLFLGIFGSIEGKTIFIPECDPDITVSYCHMPAVIVG